MPQAEIILFWITVFTYVTSFCFSFFSFISQKRHVKKTVIWLLWLGFVFHTATGIVRWISANHPPVASNYELNLTGTWLIILAFLLCNKIKKVEHSILLVLTPIVFLILGHGYMSRTETLPMGPAYRSPWLAVHVIFAWLAFGSYLISAGAAFLLLIREKYLLWKPTKNLPEQKALDMMSYRYIVLGFISHAVMLVSGAIWAKKLWGYYWNWDALETWSLLAFLFYAFYLHVRSFFGWKMKTAAWLAALGLIIMSISFWGVQWFAPSMHPGP